LIRPKENVFVLFVGLY